MFWIAKRLLFDLFSHQAQKTLHVDDVWRFRKAFGRRSKITGDRETNGSAYLFRNQLGLTAQVNQRQVSPHTETDQCNRFVIVSIKSVTDNRMQIFGCAIMGQFRLTIDLATAAAEIPGKDIPAASRQLTGHAGNIMTTGITFQPMRNDCQSLIPNLQPVKIEEIMINSLNAFSPVIRRVNFTKKWWPDCFQVTIKQIPGTFVDRKFHVQ